MSTAAFCSSRVKIFSAICKLIYFPKSKNIAKASGNAKSSSRA
jgi:hypothetical protein